MSAARITCHVSAPGDQELPGENAQPFWQAIDALADAIADSLRARGIDPDALGHAGANEHGSLLTMSSDAPTWAAYFWIHLPAESAAQAALMPIILDHLSRARNAAPDATWEVTLGDEPLVWVRGKFHLIV